MTSAKKKKKSCICGSRSASILRKKVLEANTGFPVRLVLKWTLLNAMRYPIRWSCAVSNNVDFIIIEYPSFTYIHIHTLEDFLILFFAIFLFVCYCTDLIKGILALLASTWVFFFFFKEGWNIFVIQMIFRFFFF